MFRLFLAVALLAAPIADAACYVDANGNMVCDAPARTAVRRGLFGRTYTRTVAPAPAPVVTSPRYSTTNAYQSGGSYSTYGGGSSGEVFKHWGPMTAAERAVSARYGTASEPAGVSSSAPSGSAACDCGCQGRIKELEERVEALEAAKFTLPRVGKAFSFTARQGPAFAFTRPEPVELVAMR